ncbi:DUF3320 domain-containing protein [Actinacidiphila yeochonensis]|uniref:DUF3320 domain-containing protein n=1 Tax=Actinacidiphila yeochonensis TaxID=89050 RepID=UPI00068B3DD3|nr:DUF3320 domain-containing protein [Actinacidiphila yeochonensis]
MSDRYTSGPGPAQEEGDGRHAHGKLQKVLGEWRDSLLDLGGRNRLLNFRHTRTATLEIAAPGYAPVLERLGRGWQFAPVREPGSGGAVDLRKETVQPASTAETGTQGLVTQKVKQASLDAALRTLRSRTAQTFNDYGLWVLWLGVGMINWREPGAQEVSAAPLLLVPVELRRDGGGHLRLHVAEGQERTLNAALAVKATRMGLDWTPVAEADPADAQAVLAAARRVAARQEGWSVEERVVLALFASYKEAMYQDLFNNEELIAAHPLVRAVALGPDAGLPEGALDFEPPALDRIDEIQLPESTPLVLDADASQRQSVAAALDGRSFVVSGPPGTGKSQTITNMIAALMHAGRTVLFVSEKAAALDVVRNRLGSVGLGDFVLALHSGDTSKKAVATELHRVLSTEVRSTGAAHHELDQARRLREELTGYAAAMNQPREPLGRTLHDVLGALSLLDRAGTPQLTVRRARGASERELTEATLLDLTTAAGVVGRAWRPVAEGDTFVWRGLEGDSPVATVEEADDTLHALRKAVERRPFTDGAEPRTVPELLRVVASLREGLPEKDRVASADTVRGPSLPEDVTAGLAQLADLLGARKPETPTDAHALLALADLTGVPNRPADGWFDPVGLKNAHAAAERIRVLLDEEARARAAASDAFGEQVLTAPQLPELVRRFAEEHRGLTARFSGVYKADRQAVVLLTRDGVWHKSLPGRLEQALTWQKAAAEVARHINGSAPLLGRYTPRTNEDLGALDEALAVADRVAALGRQVERRDVLAALLADGAEPDTLPGLLTESVRAAFAQWCRAAEQRAANWTSAADSVLDLFGATRRGQLSAAVRGTFEQARQAVDLLLADPRGPEEWRAYQDGVAVFARHGVAELVPLAAERGVAPELLPSAVEYTLLRAWADHQLAADSRLRSTRSAELDIRVADFQTADRRLIAAAGGAVVEACNKRRPRNLGVGAAAVIKRQAELQRRHMPVRELLARTKDVVHRIKPCFMMSPLTVSQFLPSDFTFDVVIFDEASQVRPADAVNCVYRGRSLIVAGDEKQLPPTSFFDSSVEEDSEDYDEDTPDSFESLLQACKAGALRELPLRWHYRSRHEDLITFSNRSFYGNSMVTFPGATDEGNDVGVAYFLADGVYDRGGRRDNRKEAALVAERVIHHFDTRPGRTLGVVALSQAQAAAIDQEVQQARLMRPDLDHCFTEDRLGGFFVKNLESVQGDERDVMIMSIGYGPDEHGRLGLNFGPINKEAGWRRLNVAVTRARYRMEVIASFSAGSLGESTNPSVQHLKRYLEYAQKGPASLALDMVQPDAEPESPFEVSVLDVLREWGYEVRPQVGVAGYRIDLGLRHPTVPGSYALGIECDGAMYHSSQAARDRDRLREEVLVGLGWTLHRIWGTDWYRDRTAAEQRLRDAVERAVAVDPRTAWAGQAPAAPAAPVPAAAEPAPAAERVLIDTAPERPWSAAYEVCLLEVNPRHELHTAEARPTLRKLLTRVIETEGPVHEELLVLRVREAWGVGRAGARIRDNIHQVVRSLVEAGLVVADGDFLDAVGRQVLRARRPAADVTRKCAHLPATERRLALRELTAESPGMSRDELVRQTSDYFGWKRLGPDIRSALDADIAALLAQGALIETAGGFALPPRSAE